MNYAISLALFSAYFRILIKTRNKPWLTAELLRQGIQKGEQMPASRADIIGWLQEASEAGARWVVIKCDQFDYHGNPNDKCCYPVALTRAEEVWKTIENGDRTMEVYDLSLPIDTQMAQQRAYHPPERSTP